MISPQYFQSGNQNFCQKTIINTNLLDLLSFEFLLKIYTNH